MIPGVLKNFNLFIDGRGYAGRVDEITLPKLSVKTQEFQLGGLDTPVQMDMGMEALECGFTLCDYDIDVIRLFAAVEQMIPLVLRGGLHHSNGAVVPMKVTLHGHVKELDFGNWSVSEKSSLRLQLALRYYQLQIGTNSISADAAAPLIEIDVDNFVRRINNRNQIPALSQ